MKNVVISFFTAIKNSISYNLIWKLFSLVLAFCAWFIVINVTSPMEVRTFSAKLVLSGVEKLEDSNRVVVQNQSDLEGKNVTIKIRGARLDLEALYKRRNEIAAVANLGVIYNYSLEENALAPIDVILPSLQGIPDDRFDVVSKSPQYADITLEEIITEERPVRILTEGEPEEGYIAHVQEPTPSTVNITGPKSIIYNVETVAVNVSVSGATSDVIALCAPVFYDRAMNQVPEIECDTTLIDVLVTINKVRKVPVSASYIGEPAPGYVVTGVNWEPRELEIVGDEDDVMAFRNIQLTPVNISGMSETSIASYDVRGMRILPESVSIRNGTPNTVNISVTIEEVLQKQIIVPVSEINIVGGAPDMEFEIIDTDVVLEVKGSESKIHALEENSIKLSLTLPEQGSGVQLIPVSADMPVGITYAAEMPLVTVDIKGEEPEETELPEETEVPTDAQEILDDNEQAITSQ